MEHLHRQRLEPLDDGSHAAAQMERNTLSIEQALGTLDILCRRRVLERFERKAILLVPLAGANVQLIQSAFRTDALMKPLAQQVRKKMVIAVPAPFAIQRDHEQIGAFQIFQGLLPGDGRVQQNGVA